MGSLGARDHLKQGSAFFESIAAASIRPALVLELHNQLLPMHTSGGGTELVPLQQCINPLFPQSQPPAPFLLMLRLFCMLSMPLVTSTAPSPTATLSLDHPSHQGSSRVLNSLSHERLHPVGRLFTLRPALSLPPNPPISPIYSQVPSWPDLWRVPKVKAEADLSNFCILAFIFSKKNFGLAQCLPTA